MRPSAAALALIAGLAGFLLLLSPQRGAFDFQAYYCAGAAVHAHADPYRVQPLQACETRQTRGTYAALPAGVALPAPLPGYDIAIFALLAMLPFAVAKAVWGALLGIGVAATLVALHKTFALHYATLFAAFAASLVLPSLGFGEPFALYAGALAASAYFIARERWTLAAIAAACTMIEPGLGLPVCVALFVCTPRTRVPLTICGVVLGGISLVAIGAGANVEYFATVLRLHALSEITSDAQLSAAAALFALGVPAGIALTVNSVLYVAIVAISIGAGARLARRYGDRTFLIVTPAAFALGASTFVHVSAYFAALPLAVALLHHSRKKAIACAAACLAAVPWMDAVQQGSGIAALVLGALVIFTIVWSEMRKPLIAAAAALASAGFLYAMPTWYAERARVAPRALALAELDSRYPQASWQRYNIEHLSSETAPSWILRGASWGSLLVLAAAL